MLTRRVEKAIQVLLKKGRIVESESVYPPGTTISLFAFINPRHAPSVFISDFRGHHFGNAEFLYSLSRFFNDDEVGDAIEWQDDPDPAVSQRNRKRHCDSIHVSYLSSR